jgi:hypothetical protein
MMKRLTLPILLALLSFTSVANADSIAIGQLSYLGVTPNGSSIFKVSLTPPAGTSLMSLGAAIFIGDDKLVFSLPSGNEFLFITGPGTAFSNCPCVEVHFDFIANHETTVMFQGQTLTLKQRSHSFLRPLDGAKFLIPGQSSTIFLSTIPGKDKKAAAQNIAAVPEPSTWVLIASGVGMILGESFRRVS